MVFELWKPTTKFPRPRLANGFLKMVFTLYATVNRTYLLGSHGKGSVQKYSAISASVADILYISSVRKNVLR